MVKRYNKESPFPKDKAYLEDNYSLFPGVQIPVLHLLPNLVCEGSLNDSASMAEQEEHEIFLLHAIIYVEVAAICVLALKLAYDSWHYFRHGQLPWIATKLL